MPDFSGWPSVTERPVVLVTAVEQSDTAAASGRTQRLTSSDQPPARQSATADAVDAGHEVAGGLRRSDGGRHGACASACPKHGAGRSRLGSSSLGHQGTRWIRRRLLPSCLRLCSTRSTTARGIELAASRYGSTNNSTASRAGFGGARHRPRASFGVERRAALSAAGDGSGGDRGWRRHSV